MLEASYGVISKACLQFKIHTFPSVLWLDKRKPVTLSFQPFFCYPRTQMVDILHTITLFSLSLWYYIYIIGVKKFFKLKLCRKGGMNDIISALMCKLWFSSFLNTRSEYSLLPRIIGTWKYVLLKANSGFFLNKLLIGIPCYVTRKDRDMKHFFRRLFPDL